MSPAFRQFEQLMACLVCDGGQGARRWVKDDVVVWVRPCGKHQRMLRGWR